MTGETQIPFWVDVLSVVLVLTGALSALIGSFGVLRLPTFFQRVHAPTLCTTVATWSLTLATALQSSFVREQPFVHAGLIAVFIAITAPVTTIFLMRAAVFRQHVREVEAAAQSDAPRV